MDRPIKIFFYENDIGIAPEIKKILQQPPGPWNGPDPTVIHHYRAKEASEEIEKVNVAPDIALLDVHEKDDIHAGYRLCREIKAKWSAKPVPVVMLSDRETIVDKKLGYEAGADNYLEKSELHKEDYPDLIWTVLRGLIKEHLPGVPIYSNGSLHVDKDLYKVHWRGEQVNLLPANIDIVDKLANNVAKGVCRTYRVLAAAGLVWKEPKKDEEENVKERMLQNSIDSLKKRIQIIRDAFTEVDGDFKAACMVKPYRYGIIADPGEGYRWLTDDLNRANR